MKHGTNCFATDTDGFVIPSLGIEETDQTKVSSPEVEIHEPPPKVCNSFVNISLCCMATCYDILESGGGVVCLDSGSYL